MSVSLANMVAQLQDDLPARSGVPSAAQFERAIKDAVADYGRRRSLERVTTLTIVSGQAAYDLPADFLYLIRLAPLAVGSGVLLTSDGLVPVSADYAPTYTIAGLTITFHPTPAYTTTRELTYAAGHVLDADDAYPSLTEADAAVLLLKAQALCLRLQARAAAVAGEVTEYQVGDERVKRAAVSERLAQAADDAEVAYLTAVKAIVGVVGMRG